MADRPMSAERIAGLRALKKAADTSRCPVCDDDTGDPPDYCNCGEALERYEAAARTALPDALDEIERLRSALEDIIEPLNRCRFTTYIGDAHGEATAAIDIARAALEAGK